MAHGPFRTLGIEPTADVLAIKRAYAKALKQCRPDDDPQGYQRLRDALEWALALAREPQHECQDEDSEDTDATEIETAQPAGRVEVARQDGSPVPGQDHVASAADPIDGAPGDEPIEQDWVDPGELARSFHHFWKAQGDAAAENAWPRLEFELDRMPLRLRDETSSWFASLVLDCPDLPMSVVRQLADYFQWGQDFRSDAALGDQRALALAKHLREAGLRRVVDPTIRARFAELLQLNGLIEAGQHSRATLFAALASPKNAQRLSEAAPAVLKSLGIDESAIAALRQKLLVAFVYRLLPLGLLYGVVAHLSGAVELRIAIGLAFLAPATAPIVVGAVWFLRQLVETELQKTTAWLGTSPPGWGRCAASIVIAITCGLLPAWLDWGPASSGFLFFCGALFALRIVWSRELPWCELLAPIAIALGFAIHPLLDGTVSHPTMASCSIALSWTLAAHWALISRPNEVLALYRAPLSALLPKTVFGWIFVVIAIKGVALIVAALLILSLPLTYLTLALRHGTHYTALAIALALGVGALFDGRGATWLVCLLLVPIAAAAIQGIASRLSKLRWLHRLPANGNGDREAA